MAKKPFVRIIRSNSLFGSTEDLEVFINGKHVGDVSPVSHQDFSVPPGVVKVYVKMDWCRSPELVFDMDVEKNNFAPLEVELPEIPLYSAIFDKQRFFRLKVARSLDFQR